MAEAQRRDESGRRELHSILCRRLFDAEATEEWYLHELASTEVTVETALRTLELRHSERELKLLEDSSDNARRSSKAALLIAAISALVSLASIVVAVWSVERVQDMRVMDRVAVEVREP